LRAVHHHAKEHTFVFIGPTAFSAKWRMSPSATCVDTAIGVDPMRPGSELS
jgi:hypothetical protein